MFFSSQNLQCGGPESYPVFATKKEVMATSRAGGSAGAVLPALSLLLLKDKLNDILYT